MLRTGHLGRVESAVDVDEGFPVVRELPCRGIRQSLRVCETPCDLAIAVDLAEVVWRRHQRVVHRTSLAGLARLEKLHVFAGGRDFLEVIDGLIVGGELVVGARSKTEDRLRRRQTHLADQHDRDAEEKDEGDEPGKDPHARSIQPRVSWP